MSGDLNVSSSPSVRSATSLQELGVKQIVARLAQDGVIVNCDALKNPQISKLLSNPDFLDAAKKTLFNKPTEEKINKALEKAGLSETFIAIDVSESEKTKIEITLVDKRIVFRCPANSGLRVMVQFYLERMDSAKSEQEKIALFKILEGMLESQGYSVGYQKSLDGKDKIIKLWVSIKQKDPIKEAGEKIRLIEASVSDLTRQFCEAKISFTEYFKIMDEFKRQITEIHDELGKDDPDYKERPWRLWSKIATGKYTPDGDE